MSKSAEAFRTISEVADELGVPKHVLRFWEGKFTQIRPMKRGGGRRFYRPEDLNLLKGIRHLLHREAYTIKGVQRILREQGVEAVKRRGESEGAAAAGEERAGPDGPVRIGNAPAKMAAEAAPHRARVAGNDPPPQLRIVLATAIAELRACRVLLSQA